MVIETLTKTQPNLLGEVQASERPCLKKEKVIIWPPHICTCMYTYMHTHMNTQGAGVLQIQHGNTCVMVSFLRQFNRLQLPAIQSDTGLAVVVKVFCRHY